jgi:hypothetical protein
MEGNKKAKAGSTELQLSSEREVENGDKKSGEKKPAAVKHSTCPNHSVPFITSEVASGEGNRKVKAKSREPQLPYKRIVEKPFTDGSNIKKDGKVVERERQVVESKRDEDKSKKRKALSEEGSKKATVSSTCWQPQLACEMVVEKPKLEGRKSKKDGNAVETERQDVVRKREAEKSTLKIVKKCKWEAELDTWDKDRAPSFGPAGAAKMRKEETLRRKEEAMWAQKAEEEALLAKQEEDRLKRRKKKEEIE